jgi:hypothetical protein
LGFFSLDYFLLNLFSLEFRELRLKLHPLMEVFAIRDTAYSRNSS